MDSVGSIQLGLPLVAFALDLNHHWPLAISLVVVVVVIHVALKKCCNNLVNVSTRQHV